MNLVLRFPNTQPLLYRYQTFDFAFEAEESTEGMKKMIIQEVAAFRNQVRQEAAAHYQQKQEQAKPQPTRKDT
jgi:hypothetical protein